jgi:hypothetical protein
MKTSPPLFRHAAAVALFTFLALAPARADDYSREVTDLKTRLSFLSENEPDDRPRIKALQEEIIVAQKRDSDEAARIKASMLTVDFTGGSLEQLISQINEGRPTPLNLIAEKSHLSLKLPAVSLVFSQSSSEYAPVFVTRTIPGAAPQNRRNFQCIDISELLEGMPGDRTAHVGRQKVYTLGELEAVIQSAWKMHSNSELPSDFRTFYNKETYLLLISGPSEAVNVAMTTLSRLPKPLKTP